MFLMTVGSTFSLSFSLSLYLTSRLILTRESPTFAVARECLWLPCRIAHGMSLIDRDALIPWWIYLTLVRVTLNLTAPSFARNFQKSRIYRITRDIHIWFSFFFKEISIACHAQILHVNVSRHDVKLRVNVSYGIYCWLKLRSIERIPSSVLCITENPLVSFSWDNVC